MNSSQPALRKAAIVIATLDTHSADTLLEKMPPESAAIVRELMAELAEISPAERDAVLREFMTAGGNVADEEFDGVELDPSLADKLHSPDGYSDYSPTTAAASQAPFRFLKDATPQDLARHLERQHPQVIAVVTAHLPPQQAADLLKQFPTRLQADVLRRVAELDLADPEALQVIERELESLLQDELRSARNRQSGLATVSTILNAAGAERGVLLDSLTRHEHELARQLHGKTHRPSAPARAARSAPQPPAVVASRVNRPPAQAIREVAGLSAETVHDRERNAPPSPDPSPSPPDVSFEELAALGDDDWAVLIRTAEPPIVLLALTGASEQLLQRITQQLSKREAQALRSRLQQTGPLRLSDIEHAQKHIAGIASRLATQGQIRMPERRGFAAAA